MEIGAGVEDGFCICEDAQQEDATFSVLPDDVKASFRQEIYERSYKVRSNAGCARSCQNGHHIMLCSLWMPHCHHSSIWSIVACNVCCNLAILSAVNGSLMCVAGCFECCERQPDDADQAA